MDVALTHPHSTKAEEREKPQMPFRDCRQEKVTVAMAMMRFYSLLKRNNETKLMGRSKGQRHRL